MIWRGSQNDALLEYDGYIANYWTVEDWLYDIFKEDLREENKLDEYLKANDENSNKRFNKRLKENSYLIDDIFSMIRENNIL